MHVAIEARSLSNQGSGTRTYTYQLLRHLLHLQTGDRYTILLDEPLRVQELAAAETRVVPLAADFLLPWWLQRRVPQALKNIPADVVHFTKADAARLTIPSVTTIFDVIPLLFPASQALTRRWYWPGALKRAATLSTHILTISEATKRDIIERYGRQANDITVTQPAVDLAHFQPSGMVGRKKAILFVGTRDLRKNVGALLRAFARIAREVPHRLIIAGKPALRRDGAEAEARRLNITDRVAFKEFVPYDELPGLYRSAELFVWPSAYEGWGFPPQEAMASGTPVIVSDGGALPEVVGEAGSIVPFTQADLAARTRDGDFERRLAQEMLRVLGDAKIRRDMHEAGLQRIRKFSWEEVAVATQQVYEAVAGKL
jgi:glycosyltransferase involved in cell wall biosynthesis